MSENWNIEEGSITFWVRGNKLCWNDGSLVPFVNLNQSSGSIVIFKDSDNKLKFFHVVLGLGRSDIEFDVSNLDSNKDHFVAVTWSKKSKENQLFIDGKLVSKIKNSFQNTLFD